MEFLNWILETIFETARIGGGLYFLFGAIMLGSSIKDHNGPQLSQSIWHVLGAIIILLAAWKVPELMGITL